MSKARKKKAKVEAAEPTEPIEPTETEIAANIAEEGDAEAVEELTPDSAAAAEAEPEPEPEPEPDPWGELTAERDEYKEKWLRVVAELDNVRKRSSRELVQTRKFAQADVLRSFLEIQDNFERALQSAPDEADTGSVASFREGVELINQRLRDVLKDKGVAPMEVLEKEFDPTFHEAVGQLPRDGVEPGLVIEVVQQGYHYGDMVLRPARVIISA